MPGKLGKKTEQTVLYKPRGEEGKRRGAGQTKVKRGRIRAKRLGTKIPKKL